MSATRFPATSSWSTWVSNIRDSSSNSSSSTPSSSPKPSPMCIWRTPATTWALCPLAMCASSWPEIVAVRMWKHSSLHHQGVSDMKMFNIKIVTSHRENMLSRKITEMVLIKTSEYPLINSRAEYKPGSWGWLSLTHWGRPSHPVQLATRQLQANPMTYLQPWRRIPSPPWDPHRSFTIQGRNAPLISMDLTLFLHTILNILDCHFILPVCSLLLSLTFVYSSMQLSNISIGIENISLKIQNIKKINNPHFVCDFLALNIKCIQPFPFPAADPVHLCQKHSTRHRLSQH